MKYVVLMPCDQTITYLTNSNMETTNHKQVGIWDTFPEAVIAMQAYIDISDVEGAEVVEIYDVEEFRSRRNTW